MSGNRSVLLLPLLIALAGCGNQVRPPNRQEQESVRKSQELFKGQREVSRSVRLPDSHPKGSSKEEGWK